MYNDATWWIRATDTESNTITATLVVQDAGTTITTSGLTLTKDESTNAPYNFKLQFTSSSYSAGAITRGGSKALTVTITIDDGISL